MLRIRNFSPGYIDSLNECFNLVFDETEIAYYKSIRDFSHSLIGLDDNDKVKAFIVVHKTEGKIRDYEIAYLGVHKEYRGLGYAKILLKKIIDKFKGSCLWLNALANNHIACNLYKEHGFKEMERIIDTSGNNAIIFATVECLS